MNNEQMLSLKRLIIVTGLAIPREFDDLTADSSWVLQDFQKGEPPFFLAHIRCGVELADSQPDSLLLFSGGQTRAEAEPLSEGQGYFLAAEHLNWFNRPDVKLRASTEEFATDSPQNVIFSICRFRECVGRYPEYITLVSYAFKERRFDLHRAAIRLPNSRFTFIGPNNPPDLESAKRGEEDAIAEFTKCPYGTEGELAAKRRRRNPFRRQHGYASSCPELHDLLDYGRSELFSGSLPWD